MVSKKAISQEQVIVLKRLTDRTISNEREADFVISKYSFNRTRLYTLKDLVDSILPDILKEAGASQGLKWDEILTLEKLAEKSVANMLSAIEKSKQTTLSRLIFALGIRHIGEEMAEVLAGEFKDLDDLANAPRERLISIPTIGPKIADSIVTFFNRDENKGIISRLKDAGVWPKQKITRREELPLSGKEFVITGRLEAFSRQEAEARIKALGGSTGSTVTRKTTYLVVGAEPGSKLARAQALGTELLTEEELLHRLEINKLI